MTRAEASPSLASRGLYWLAIALLSLRFADLYYNPEYETLGGPLARLLDGSAQTPFQYRMLSPWLIELIATATGVSLQTACLLYAALCTIALVAVLHLLLRQLGLPTPLVHAAGGAVFLPLWSLFVALEYARFWYPWDLLIPVTVALGLLLLLQRRRLAFLAVLVLATFNHENAFFLGFLSVAVLWDDDDWPKLRLVGFVATQALLWLAVKGLMAWLYPDNPGHGLAAGMLGENLGVILGQPDDLLLLVSLFGGAWMPVAWFWRRLPSRELQRCLLACLAHAAILLWVGKVLEIRIYVLFLPVVWAAAALLLCRFLDRAAGPSAPQRGAL